MTRLTTILGSLSLVFFLATGSLYADSAFFSSAEGLRINVPFDFYVGHQTFPAGEYRLVPVDTRTGLYRIYSSNGGKQSAYFDTTFVQTADDTKSTAVFKKSGRHNVLKTAVDFVSEAKRLRELETENRKLKQLLAESHLDNAPLKELLSKNW